MHVKSYFSTVNYYYKNRPNHFQIRKQYPVKRVGSGANPMMQKTVGVVNGTDGFKKSNSNSRLKNCQSEAEFIDRQLKKKSRVLSSHLCRRPMNVII